MRDIDFIKLVERVRAIEQKLADAKAWHDAQLAAKDAEIARLTDAFKAENTRPLAGLVPESEGG